VSQYGGVVGENHVLLLIPEREDAVTAEMIAALLNSPEANAAYSRVGGTATISAKLLATLPIPKPMRGRLTDPVMEVLGTEEIRTR